MLRSRFSMQICGSSPALSYCRLEPITRHPSRVVELCCVVPFLKQGGPWYSSMCNHWWGVVGIKRKPGKDYVLLSWLDFGTWDLTTAKMLLKFTGQLVRALPGSFLAELFTELRRECLRPKKPRCVAVRCPTFAQSRFIFSTR